MPFYTYWQNPIRGNHVFDEGKGITTYVIIEADTADKANIKVRDFPQDYCECCGVRWDTLTEWDAKDNPEVHGEHPADMKCEYGNDDKAVCIHYKDGSRVWYSDKEKQPRK